MPALLIPLLGFWGLLLVSGSFRQHQQLLLLILVIESIIVYLGRRSFFYIESSTTGLILHTIFPSSSRVLTYGDFKILDPHMPGKWIVLGVLTEAEVLILPRHYGAFYIIVLENYSIALLSRKKLLLLFRELQKKES